MSGLAGQRNPTMAPTNPASSKRQRRQPAASLGMESLSGKILDVLLSRVGAAELRTITYAELARAVGVRVCNLRHPMDHLSHTLAEYASRRGDAIPPIQTLIVNGTTGLPGSGASPHIRSPYVRGGETYASAGSARRKEIAQAICVDVSTFRGWKRVRRDIISAL